MKVAGLILLTTAAVVFWWFAWPLLVIVAGGVLVAAVTAFIVRLARSAWRVYTAVAVDGPSPVPLRSGHPAFPRYAAAQVWRDYAVVLRHTLSVVSRPFLLTAGATQVLVGGWHAAALAPMWLAMLLGLGGAALWCAVLLLVVSGGYVLFAGTAAAVQFAGVVVLRGLDEALVSARRTRPACPHPGCYQAFPRPEYGCPGCETRHRDLRPGRYGVLRRVCRCGATLPTSVLLGRERLVAYCPHCQQQLAERLAEAPLVHLPLVGGPAAGKSTYAHLAIAALDGAAGRVRFADEREATNFSARVKLLRAGGRVPPTAVTLPQATVLYVSFDDARRCVLYLFDPPGEHYTNSDRIAWQRYLDLATGLLLVVDPFSLEPVRRSLTPGDLAELSDVTPATHDAAHVVDRLVAALRTRPDSGRLQRIAVVLTKDDALRLTSIGSAIGDEPSTDTVRRWLLWVGWGNGVRTLERAAREVGYFASGLDVPEERIAEPVRWLLDGALQGRRVAPVPAPPSGGAVPTALLTPTELPVRFRQARQALLVVVFALTAGTIAFLLAMAGSVVLTR